MRGVARTHSQPTGGTCNHRTSPDEIHVGPGEEHFHQYKLCKNLDSGAKW